MVYLYYISCLRYTILEPFKCKKVFLLVLSFLFKTSHLFSCTYQGRNTAKMEWSTLNKNISNTY